MSTNTLAPSVVTSRDKKGLKFVSVVEAAYNKAGLTEEEAQRVNEAAGLSDLIDGFIAEHRSNSRFKDEEVSTNLRYPSEYHGPKPIEEQIAALAAIFGLDPAKALEYAKSLPELPHGTEGWFAIPCVDALAAKHFPEVIDPGQKYCRAVELVLDKIAAKRAFYNYRANQIDTAHLRVSARTMEAMAKLEEQQKSEILIIAAQLGMVHKGQSVRRAHETFAANEYGLTSVTSGSIVLTHPERLVRFEELDMDMAGDEFSHDGDDVFDHAPYLSFGDDKVEFGAGHVFDARGGCGSASFRLPQ